MLSMMLTLGFRPRAGLKDALPIAGNLSCCVARKEENQFCGIFAGERAGFGGQCFVSPLRFSY